MATPERPADAAAHAFAFLPNRYAHETWRAALLPAPPLWDLLGQCPRTEGRLATFVAARARLSGAAPLRLDTPRERFCLLPWEAVANVARRLGLVLNAGRFGKVIDGRLVARIKRDLGADAYEFALRRAPLITAQSDPLAPDLAAGTPLNGQLERSGVNYIALALRGVATEVLDRFKLKLPVTYAVVIEAPQGTVPADAAWTVVRKVVREAEPEWNATLE